MRAFVVSLIFLAVPIYFGATLLGNSSGFSIGAFSSLSDVRQQLGANDFARDALSEAHNYAATHPGIVAAVKSHRAELQELRLRVCAALTC